MNAFLRRFVCTAVAVLISVGLFTGALIARDRRVQRLQRVYHAIERVAHVEVSASYCGIMPMRTNVLMEPIP